MSPILSRLSSTGGGGLGGFGFGRKVSSGPIPFSASGGTKYEPGNGFVYHMFTSPATISKDSGTSSVVACEVLLVGGGGGGTGTYNPNDGDFSGGGGGAGGHIYYPGMLVDFSSSISVTIGNGGVSTGEPVMNNPSIGGFGSDSTFAPGTPQALTAKGGGGGGSISVPGASLSGGSGGGKQGAATQPTQPGNSGIYGRGSAGAPPGGDCLPGGGGAGGVGGQGSNSKGGAGGAGYPTPVFPGPLFTSMPTAWKSAVGPTGLFAGGGGGGTNGVAPIPERIPGGAPGPGGGGRGTYYQAPTPSFVNCFGVANTGGGGGGCGWGPRDYYNGSGGAGICIIRYPISA